MTEILWPEHRLAKCRHHALCHKLLSTPSTADWRHQLGRDFFQHERFALN